MLNSLRCSLPLHPGHRPCPPLWRLASAPPVHPEYQPWPPSRHSAAAQLPHPAHQPRPLFWCSATAQPARPQLWPQGFCGRGPRQQRQGPRRPLPGPPPHRLPPTCSGSAASATAHLRGPSPVAAVQPTQPNQAVPPATAAPLRPHRPRRRRPRLRPRGRCAQRRWRCDRWRGCLALAPAQLPGRGSSQQPLQAGAPPAHEGGTFPWHEDCAARRPRAL
mmetsp:Transcript_80583/g.236817  ORF Transcript_80583/g.236817 Transcript_80583/m.236817 type:complete len:219 (+) Transcript_80583:150-806(+)